MTTHELSAVLRNCDDLPVMVRNGAGAPSDITTLNKACIDDGKDSYVIVLEWHAEEE